ncbi:hypothetical protein SKAU_G00176410 [Synaphobranchus kaupii]|uniref:VWFA domain-containing protein n=1 Tax=Synaphobranchus kaupii TaxID=118154 RepID=A0A9Q1FLI5_SYNKA|nr:hypothetical protein SKAU_G00176410 [Synaphobranchus kaupii]
MLGVRTVLLCVCIATVTHGALVISRDALSQGKVEVRSVKVNCRVASRFAHTIMTSIAINRANTSKEVFFGVELPKTAFITKFSMASGRKMEKFSVSVNIAAQSEVTFTLTHEELLKRIGGKYELMTRVKPQQLIQNFEAHISFSPTLEQQRVCPDCDGTLIDGDFIIKYDVKREKGIGDIQTREALLTILDDLDEDDHFSLILFDHEILKTKPSLSKATKENVEDAKVYVRDIEARGSTNINDAVIEAVKMLQEDKARKRLPERSVSMVILLTDGQPNSGESRLDKIQENVRNAMNKSMTLFCLGFGFHLDYNFLDVMAKENNGLARRIYADSDASLQLHVLTSY